MNKLNFRRFLIGFVADMRKNGENIPAPLSAKSFSGKFVVRVPPEVHKELVISAAEEGVSLNRLVSARLCKILDNSRAAFSALKGGVKRRRTGQESRGRSRLGHRP